MPWLLPSLCLAALSGVWTADVLGRHPDASGLAPAVASPAAVAVTLLSCLGLTAALSGALRSPTVRAVAALVAVFAAGALALGQALVQARQAVPEAPREAIVEARVCEKRATPEIVSLVACDLRAVTGPSLPERLRWVEARETGLGEVQVGDRVRASLRVVALDPPRNPGARDRARAEARRGIGARARLTRAGAWVFVERARRGGTPRRARAVQRLQNHGTGGGLLAALALGESGGVAPADRRAFARLGVAHVLVVSGLHLTLVAGAVFGISHWLATRWSRLSRRRGAVVPALVLAFSVAWIYAELTGGQVPVRRAALLWTGVGFAYWVGRPRAGLHALALAALLMLIARPHAAFEAGPQLSFAASGALLAAAARHRPHPRARVPAGVRAAFEGSVVAGLATAPILAAHGMTVSLVGALANALVVPWTTLVLLPLAFAAAACAAAGGGETPLALAAHVAAATSEAIRTAGDGLPAWEPAGAVAGVPLLAAAGAAVAGIRVSRLRWRLVLAVAQLALLSVGDAGRVGPALPRAVALDVGQGEATLVEGREAAVLVDAGRARDGFDHGARTVVPALRALGVGRLALVAVSHADLDHRGGIVAVLEAVPTDRLWLPRGSGRDPGMAALRARAERLGTSVSERGAGDPAAVLGDLRIEPLWPPPELDASWSRNDRSLVLRVAVGGHSLMLTGDLEARGERALLARHPEGLASTLLKLAHHGSGTSSTGAWLRAVRPAVVWVSSGCGGAFPAADVWARTRRAGAARWWTGRDGAVAMRLGDPLHVYGWLDRGRCRAPGP
ncbi:MAG: ComEC/Rec2 family competence protein [Proteobacteria bacterium]|nr:ComEC/Rec2 family competence protein [Pseudomonadota bacterium]